jgi:CheY-like chemotaxis protein
MTDPGQAAQFEAMLRQMRAGFLAELPERCDRLEGAILALEADPAAEGVYEELYRNVHSLKGSGGTFGIAVITSICHQFETFLAEHHGHYGQAFGSTALGYIDLLRQAGELAAHAKPDFQHLEAALERLRASVLQSREPVLVAESSGMMKALYQQALAGLPVQPTFVENGLEALERLLRSPFRLLIIGRELADLNGMSVIAALRESGSRNRLLPVILVSSSREKVAEHLRVDQVLPRDMELARSLPAAVSRLLKPGAAESQA